MKQQPLSQDCPVNADLLFRLIQDGIDDNVLAQLRRIVKEELVQCDRVDIKNVATFVATHDIKPIVADFAMSEGRIGGDDVIYFIDSVLGAIADGYTIVTDYGFGDYGTETFVFGFRAK